MRSVKKNRSRALITGVNGQIGSYLAEFLLSKSYQVYGVIRPGSSRMNPDINYLECDLLDFKIFKDLILELHPDEIYNLAAQTDAVISMDRPEETFALNASLVIVLCEVAKILPDVRIFQANSAEIFKGLSINLLNEDLLSFYPKNPYAIAKLAAYWWIRHTREFYGHHLSNGIIFNTESIRRDPKFVVKKITSTVKRMKTEPNLELSIGNLDVQRDWIHALDVAHAMWFIIKNQNPGDYMISLGTLHSVRETIEFACKQVGFDLEWRGESVQEEGFDRLTGRRLVHIEARYFRPYEHQTIPLVGDNTRLRQLGWEPLHTWEDLITEMLEP